MGLENAQSGGDDQIKLVIWDLDETLWGGTLGEGSAVFDPSKASIVRQLNDMGVVNSICSKNDPTMTQAFMEQNGVWDQFVAPVIAYADKSGGVRHIIDALGFRPQNVVFIDDNPHNRNEVKFALPLVDVRDVDFIDELLTTSRIVRGTSRLEQYRAVALRAAAQSAAPSNVDFLRSSKIEVSLAPVNSSARAHEIVTRNNQLNFTKVRCSLSAMMTTLHDPNYECSFIRARDVYADYGVVGLIVIDKARHELVHYVLSCRILGMGIEKFVYNHLGRPKIAIVQPVVETLDDEPIDWITLTDKMAAPAPLARLPDYITDRRVVFRGGCDIAPIAQLLQARGLDVVDDYGNAKNQTQIGYLIDAIRLPDHEKERLHRQVPLVLEETYRTQLSGAVDVALISLVVEYSRSIYRERQTGIAVFNEITGRIHERQAADAPPDDPTKILRSQWSMTGQISDADFRAELEAFDALYAHIPHVIFVNGAEIDGVPNNDTHKRLNRVVDQFIAEHPERYRLVDVRKIVNSADHLREKDNIRHYVRPVYVRLYEAIERELRAVLSAQRQPENA